MTYELCTWGFIVNQYVPVETGFKSLGEAKAARDRLWAEREAEGRYTDLGTFQIRPSAA